MSTAQTGGAVSDDGITGSRAGGRSRVSTERRPPGELTAAGLGMLLLGVYSLAQGAQGEHDGLVVVGAFAFAVVIVGIAWPLIVLRGVAVDVVGPRDATVGDRVTLGLHITGRVSRLEVRLLDPPGEWRRTVAPGSGEFVHIAARRGVFRVVRVEVRSGGPLGVFLRRRTLWVRLPVPVSVGPRPVPMSYEPQTLPIGMAAALAARPAAPGGDAVRAVRPYAPGDAARLVHWPTSARTGELAVRELEPPAITGIAIVVDLRGPEENAEMAASRAAGIGRAALRAGAHLLLLTCEASGPVVAPVSGPLELGRRLARAVPDEPPSAPVGWPSVRIEGA
jgi:uncharacterized protein (DUF58 family)